MNMHMNNTQYANILWNQIDGILDKEITSFNIRFRAEAKCGSDIMMIRSVSPGDGLIIPKYGDRAADELAVFRTETGGRTNVEAVFGLRRIKR